MKTIKNFFSVLSSNITTILSGILIGFVLPLVLSIEDYGYYKTFTLYATYLGLFSLGIVDGIVLKYGGYNYERIDKRRFRSYFRWYVIIHAVISVIVVLFYPVLKEEYQKRILLMLLANMFALNIVGYFRQISEITQRFKEYSIIKVVQSLMSIISVVAVFILSKYFKIAIDYNIYIIIVVCNNVLFTTWYILLYKDLVIGKVVPLRNTFHDIIQLMYNGIPLMLANLCSTLILTIDRQFVNFLFDNKSYAIYAFAYNLLALLTVATSAVSTVLYPTLKRMTVEEASKRFSLFVSTSLIILYAFLVFYYPLVFIVKSVLPNFMDSIIIFRIIFPGLPISSTITVIIHNYYKILGESSKYFRRSVVVLAVSFLANGIAYYFFRNSLAISIASIITMFIWLIYVSCYISNKVGTNLVTDIIYSVIVTTAFYLCSGIEQWSIGLIFYIVSFIVLSYLFQWSTLFNMKSLILKKTNN